MTEKQVKDENKRSVFPNAANSSNSPAARDPLQIMVEIAKDSGLSDTDKTSLIQYSQTRFTNRRRMAYISLYAIIGTLAFLLIAAVMDGFGASSILTEVSNNQGLLGTIIGFLTAIVAAYYGVSSLRPAS